MNVLAVTFTYSDLSEQELRANCDQLAPSFAAIPGCFEKTWLLDAAASRCGGIYKFRDRAALDAYLASDLWKAVGSTPQFSNFDVRTFDVIEAPTSVTRGLPAAAAAR